MFNTFESICSCFVVHLYNCFPVPSNSSDGQSYNTVAYRVIHILLDRVRVCPQTHYIVYSNVGRGSYYCSPFSMHTCDECERYATQLHGKQNCPPCVRPRQPASATNTLGGCGQSCLLWMITIRMVGRTLVVRHPRQSTTRASHTFFAKHSELLAGQ